MSREVSVKKLFSSSLIILFIILLDQVIKALAGRFLPTACNTGFAFGIYQGILNGLIAFLVLLVVIYIFTKESSRLRSNNNLAMFGFALVIGGGASNILDRVIRGCVVDFIDLKVWPAFNLADAAITIGVGILIFSVVKQLKNEKT